MMRQRFDLFIAKRSLSKMMHQEYHRPCTVKTIKKLIKKMSIEPHLLHTDLVINGWYHIPFYFSRNALSCRDAIKRILEGPETPC